MFFNKIKNKFIKKAQAGADLGKRGVFLKGPTTDKSILDDWANTKTVEGFMSVIDILPNPDVVLKNAGKRLSVLRTLTNHYQVGTCIDSRKAGTLSNKWELRENNCNKAHFDFYDEIFKTIDKIRPAYDFTYKVFMIICKVLLIVDILITSMAVAGRYVPFIPDPAWSEEVVLTCMSYMAVLSAALAIRRNAHIRMTSFDVYLPKKVVKFLDLLADVAVLALALIMIIVGWQYASGLGAKGSYVSMPNVSRFWMYFPVPLAGVAMLVFELEAIYGHIKGFFVKEEE